MSPVALLSLSLVLISFSTKSNTLIQAQCLPDQRHALIQLKQGFHTTELHSWNTSTDCCIWDGITCDEQTGRVTALNLTDRSISGEVSSALFNLTSLRHLNLADNSFNNIPLPKNGFKKLANLTHLDLSNSGFAGQVPIDILALTNLISLDLSNYDLYLHDTGLKTLLRNLTKLQVLRLDLVDISLNGSELVKAVFQVGPALEELSMTSCGLRGNFPDEILHLTNLTELDLSYNSLLSGQLLEFTNQSVLQYLYLEFTNITGPLPDSIGNLQYLSTLSLSSCNLYGKIPPSITNNTRLDYLDLGSNRLSGMIPMSLFSHPSLKSLDLSDNQLSGYVPEFSNGSSTLAYIYLDFNNLQGQLPISIFTLAQLIVLELSSNNFNGIMNLDVITNNKIFESLNISKNALTGQIPPEIANLHKLQSLDFSCNQLSGHIPQELISLTYLSALNLSYNNLVGEIPQLNHQFSIFSNDSYLGNPRLCGSPLSMQCSAAPSSDGFNKGLPTKSSNDIIGLSISIVLGLVVGFQSVLWALISWENGREWFNLTVDKFVFSTFVPMTIYLRNLYK